MDIKRYTPQALGRKAIPLGKQGETNAVRVEFLCAGWLEEYPTARIELYVVTPGGEKYTAKLTESGSTRIWNVTEPYTAKAGSGMIELILRDAATSTVIKSVTGQTTVASSPSGDGQPAPPPDENGLNGYVRYDMAQELTPDERKRARENIGADGAGGMGGYYTPSVDEDGNLTWEKSVESMPDAEGANIKGPKGDKGDKGDAGDDGPPGPNGHTPYIGENGNWWIGGVDTETPATPQGGEGTVTAISASGETFTSDENGTVDISGATVGNAKKLGGRAPEYYTWTDNLLVNSNFQKPYLINLNAAGGTYPAWGGEVFNGWIIYATETTIGVVDSGANVSGGIYQKMTAEEARLHNGKTLTFAVKMNGVVYATSGYIEQNGAWKHAAHIVTPYGKIKIEIEDNNELWVVIENNTGNALVEWAVLIPGAYTAETLPQPQWLHPRLEMMRMGLPTQPVNLLDNSDFRNPVNQRMLVEYKDVYYTIDRWFWSYASSERKLIINDGYITIINNTSATGYMRQRFISPLKGKAYTIAVKCNGEVRCLAVDMTKSTASQTLDLYGLGGMYIQNTHDMLDIYINKKTSLDRLEWVALYEGAYTIETLPPYVPKGYEVELAECQRYYNKGRFIAYRDSALVMYPTTNHTYPVTMRKSPNLIFNRIYSFASGADINVSASNHEYNDEYGIVAVILSADPEVFAIVIEYEAIADL